MTEKEFVTDMEKTEEVLNHILTMVENILSSFEEIPDYIQEMLGLAVICGINFEESASSFIEGTISGVESTKDKIIKDVRIRNNLKRL